MSNESSNEREWSEIRSRWRDKEHAIRARDHLLQDAMDCRDRQITSRKRLQYGIAAAAAVVAVYAFTLIRAPSPDDVASSDLSAVLFPAPNHGSTGPCGLPASCVNSNMVLAQVNFDQADQAVIHAMLGPALER